MSRRETEDLIAQWLCCGGACNRFGDGCHKMMTADQRERVQGFLDALGAAGLAIRPLLATEAMKRAGSMAVMIEGAPDFPGDNTVSTISALINCEQAERVWDAMVAEGLEDA